MSHSLVYIIPFKSLRNDAFEIQILKENHLGGSPIELIGGADPLVISMEDEDFLYTPIRKSSAKITIVGSDYLQSLYSNNYHEWKVNIYRDKVLIWTGFINPETYTQDYVNETIELTVEASSALSVLENIKYESDVKGWITIWDYFKKVVKSSKGDYKGVIIPSTYQRDENNIFENLQLSEANFFDEDGEPMMMLETVEELCKFFNWTITDYNGYLTFIDIDYTGEYRIYNRALTEFTTTQPSSYSVQDLGFNGGDHTLDILPGYTKAIIKVDNYNVEDIFTDVDYDELDVLAVEAGTNYYKHNTRWQFLKNTSAWEIHHYNFDGTSMTEEEFAKVNKYSYALGSSLCNLFNYQGRASSTRPEYSVSKITYKPAILVRTKSMRYPIEYGKDQPIFEISDKEILRIKNSSVLKYTPGAICLKLGVESLTWYGQQERVNQLVAAENTNQISGLKAMFRLGKYYWNGSLWVERETFFKLPLNTESQSGFMQLETNKKLFEGPNNAEGYTFDLWSRKAPKNATGDWELIIYSSNEYYTSKDVGGFHIADLSLKFEPLNSAVGKDSRGDRIYENIVNESLITELDTIDVKISSHNNDAISHSKVLLDGEYLTDNLYSQLAGKEIRPEEQFLTRIINQYANAKLKLKQELEYKEIQVFDRITDQFMKNKIFSIAGIEYNVANSQMILNMIENNG